MYSMFAKSFSRYEQKFRYWAIIGFFFFSLSFFILIKPYFDPLPILNFQPSMDIGLKMLEVENTKSSQPSINFQPSMDTGLKMLEVENTKSSQPSSGEVTERKQICNVSDPKFDFCDAEGDIRIHGQSSKIFVVSSQMGDLVGNESWAIRPYARKRDQWMMGFIREFTVNASVGHDEAPSCTVNHKVPAVVFSTGGYAINHWHAFTDIIIPLFAASAQFHGEVQFLITNLHPQWILRYKAILKQLSRYEIIIIDTDDKIHCFPRMIVGLQYYKDLRIDPMTASKGYSMKEFRQVIRNSYSLKRSTAIKIHHQTQEKPRLLILTRNGTRKFLNADEIAELAKSMDFEVIISEAMADLDKFSHIVNSCDVMMGLHGAGLTNLVFLPSKAILIQVLPWGTLEWLASTCFGDPALDMDLRYMEYRVKEEESSLIQQYPLEHPVFKDPHSLHKNDWLKFKTLFLDTDVKINVHRFNSTLLEALELLHH